MNQEVHELKEFTIYGFPELIKNALAEIETILTSQFDPGELEEIENISLMQSDTSINKDIPEFPTDNLKILQKVIEHRLPEEINEITEAILQNGSFLPKEDDRASNMEEALNDLPKIIASFINDPNNFRNMNPNLTSQLVGLLETLNQQIETKANYAIEEQKIAA